MKEEKEVLEELNSGVSMDLHAIHAIYPEIENPHLKKDIEKQKRDYEALEEKIKKYAYQDESSKEGLETMMLKSMVKMKTMMNHDVHHLCKMLIEGSNKAVITMTSLLNQYPDMDETLYHLVETFLETAKQHIETWKIYL